MIKGLIIYIGMLSLGGYVLLGSALAQLGG